MINETRLHDTRTPPPRACSSERGADDAASLETCNFAPIYLACVLASCLLAPLTVSRHGTGMLGLAALTITLYLTATTLSVRWVWAKL